VVSRDHMAWFAALKPGDSMAVRPRGYGSSGPWRRVVVLRASGSTAWWKAYDNPSVTARSRNHDARPVTPEDEAQWLAEEQDAEIRQWLKTHVSDGSWGGPRTIDPKVRAALLAAMREVPRV
jgi:hypothetical protein